MALRGFVGTFTPRMDDKGRVTIPARYRGHFAEGVMVMKGQDRCLYLLTGEGFEDFAASAISADVTDAQARGYQRYMLANTDEQMLDGQGRVSITPRMREYAGLTKDIVITGAGLRMEIWDADRWEQYSGEHEDGYIEPERGALGP